MNQSSIEKSFTNISHPTISEESLLRCTPRRLYYTNKKQKPNETLPQVEKIESRKQSKPSNHLLEQRKLTYAQTPDVSLIKISRSHFKRIPKKLLPEKKLEEKVDGFQINENFLASKNRSETPSRMPNSAFQQLERNRKRESELI